MAPEPGDAADGNESPAVRQPRPGSLSQTIRQLHRGTSPPATQGSSDPGAASSARLQARLDDAANTALESPRKLPSESETAAESSSQAEATQVSRLVPPLDVLSRERDPTSNFVRRKPAVDSSPERAAPTETEFVNLPGDTIPSGLPPTENPPAKATKSRDILERYRSKASSLPNYAEPPEAPQKMSWNPGRALAKVLGFAPVNTLSDPASLPQAAALELPESKRQKTNHVPLHTQARFMLPSEIATEFLDIGSDSRSRTEARGSQSAVAGPVSAAGVAEFTNVEQSLRGAKGPRRARKNTPFPPQGTRSQTSVERIEDSDDEISLVGPARYTAANGTKVVQVKEIRPGGDGADAQFTHQSVKRKVSKQSPTMPDGKRRAADGHLDELQSEQVSKARKLSASDETSKSSSLSRKGDPGKTSWTNGATSNVMTTNPAGAGACIQPREAENLGSLIPVKAAVREPHMVYPRNELGESDVRDLHYFGKVRGSDDFDCFNGDGSHEESLRWMSFNPGSIRSLQHRDGSAYVTLSRSSVVREGWGALTVYQFCTSGDAQSFVDQVRNWFEKERKEAPYSLASTERLEKTFVNTYAKVAEASRKRSKLHIDQQQSQDLQMLQFNEAQRLAKLTSTPAGSASKPEKTTGLTGPDPARPLMRSRMQLTSSQTPFTEPGNQHQDMKDISDVVEPQRMTRQAYSSIRDRPKARTPSPPPLERWTEKNPDWAANWKTPLVYHRTTVDKADIPRLDEGEFLNDNLINFGLQHILQEAKELSPALEDRVFIFNSFFYDKLKPKSTKEINYDSVKSWTARKDILKYDYIVVPVNESYHWWVAIICNPGRLDPDNAPRPHVEDSETGPAGNGNTVADSGQATNGNHATDDIDRIVSDIDPQTVETALPEDATADLSKLSIDAAEPAGDHQHKVVDLMDSEDGEAADAMKAEQHGGKHKKGFRKSTGPPARKYNPEEPRVITMDSLGGPHSPACKHLKQYLLAEFEHKRNKIITETPPTIGMRATNIPQQTNHCDCGVFVLGYIRSFLQDPDNFILQLLRREKPKWKFNASDHREWLRKRILDLQKDAQIQEQENRKRKRDAKLAGARTAPMEASKAASSVSSPPSSLTTPGPEPSPLTTGPSVCQQPNAPPRAISQPPSKQPSAPTDLGTEILSPETTEGNLREVSRTHAPHKAEQKHVHSKTELVVDLSQSKIDASQFFKTGSEEAPMNEEQTRASKREGQGAVRPKKPVVIKDSSRPPEQHISHRAPSRHGTAEHQSDDEVLLVGAPNRQVMDNGHTAGTVPEAKAVSKPSDSSQHEEMDEMDRPLPADRPLPSTETNDEEVNFLPRLASSSPMKPYKPSPQRDPKPCDPSKTPGEKGRRSNTRAVVIPESPPTERNKANDKKGKATPEIRSRYFFKNAFPSTNVPEVIDAKIDGEGGMSSAVKVSERDGSRSAPAATQVVPKEPIDLTEDDDRTITLED